MSTPAAPVPRRPASANGGSGSAPSSRPASGSGLRIGPYLLGKTLGVGSTGRVKLGTHIETGQRVAIKIISRESLSQNQSPEKKTSNNMKIEREITIMKLIQHPNVLQLFDVYESEKELFLILEHVEGGELFDFLVKKGRLSEGEALKFFQQIVFGVDFCHRHLICHRDLKPENVLLDKDLNVKIADFGMASLQVTGKMLETSCGSPHYASPEVIKGIKYDGQTSDIWSCGVILYALLTGNLPFDDENIRRLLSKVKSGMYIIPEFVSVEAKDLIKKMLVVDPTQRITMRGIMEHPWFKSQTFKPVDQMYLKGALDNKEAFSKIMEGQPLDSEIIASLGLLGWGNEAELNEALKKPEANIEKVFYFLLCNRKLETMENFDVRKLQEWDIEGGPRRRADSFSSLYGDRSGSKSELTNMGKSMDELRQKLDESRKSREELNRPSAPTTPTSSSGDMLPPSRDSSAEGMDVANKRMSMPSAPVVAAAPTSPVKSARPVSEISPKAKIVSNHHASVKVNSPLSASITSADPTSYMQSASLPAYSMINESAGSSLSNVSPINTNMNDYRTPSSGGAKSLTISIPSAGDRSSTASVSSAHSGKSPDVSDVPGTPKFHRKRVTEVSSPVITSTTPKRSWFANLFNFKPETFTFVSRKNYEDTVNNIMERLTTLDVKYQRRKEGGFKCKYERGVSSDTPSPTESNESEEIKPDKMGSTTKFRIDIIGEDEDPNGIKVVFVQQQGSFTLFSSLCDKFRETWTV
ncbi:hypothetical protein SmJEL517_g00463 [Synchytrium microbalum]|uniref:non-specific serine/threonine protein kinase n=1 Tax=Synchytrium microbalum TaxID=1806994 RepID=A0A507C8M2_9FUNG|nr:uncharacterized protein SmJEL517_g00463 [Synchytrium microbalum]TPX37407.1 hypothetical protein SmJEL517_g00463 [Synchytrium microbalum]